VGSLGTVEHSFFVSVGLDTLATNGCILIFTRNFELETP
jgi:hypothetical protein